MLRKVFFSMVTVCVALAPYAAKSEELIFKVKNKEYKPELIDKKKVELKVWRLEIPKEDKLKKIVYIYQVGQGTFFTQPYYYDPKLKLLVPDPDKSAQVILEKKALSKIKEAEKLLIKEGLVEESNSKKPKIYVFLDPFCPFCKKEVREGLLDKLRGKYDVVLIPYAVHKKRSEEMIANMIYFAKGKGAKLTQVFEDVLKDDSKFTALSSINFSGKNTEYRNLASKLTKLLKEAGIPGTPAFVVGNRLFVGKLPKKYLEDRKEK